MTRCSVGALGEPLAGTASFARAYVLLEDNGPWGNKAPGTARFSAAPDLAAHATGTDTTVLLVRQPHLRVVTDRRRVWVAHPDSSRLWAGHVSDPAALLELDFAQLAEGVAPDGFAEVTDTLWLVCTNSSRDNCCALVGRPLVDDISEMAISAGVLLLESSHLGGHRFAPAALSLPSGYSYGRLTAVSATAAFDAAKRGQVLTQHVRGRSSLNRWQQVADLAARDALGWSAATGLSFSEVSAAVSAGATCDVVVTASDGRQVSVSLRASAIPDRPESCGKSPVPGISISVTRSMVLAPADN